MQDLLPLVKRIALKMHGHLPAHIEIDDLVGAGALGLVDAVRKFDPRKGATIEKYAVHRIRGAMLDALRRLDIVSRDLRKKSKKVENVYRELEAKLGRPVSDEEMAQGLHMSLGQWYHTAQELSALAVHWLRQPTGSVRQTPKDALAAQNQESQFDLYYHRERKNILDYAVSCLSKRDRLIIELYYHDGRTMKQIAAKLGIDESRVSQLHAAALLRLRSMVEEKTKARPR